jgi:tRNA A37 threonylcarbamoyladenosine dehydratase
MKERFSRLERMIGQEGLARLQNSFVVVVGLGAVGSYATEALARAGVGRLRLVDFDVIRPSNLNRQLYALESTIGRPKCDVARRRVQEINSACQVEALDCFVHKESLDHVREGGPDLVVDAIDSYNPKVELLAGMREKGIPLLSSMGAALRTDPTLIRVGPLTKASHCPLARRVRKELRSRGVDTGFLCVYSLEPVDHLPEASRGKEPAEQEDFHSRGRQRNTLGSLPTLTGIFGLIAANTALQMLLGNAFPGRRSHHPAHLEIISNEKTIHS